MNLDPISYSSSYGRNVLHMCFKAKYCHKVFEDKQVEKRCGEIFSEVAGRHRFELREVGFDGDHVHITVDAGPNHCPREIARLLKGNSGYKLLREFPYLKERYFWASGLWSPAYYFEPVAQKSGEHVEEYVRNQGRQRHDHRGQLKLQDFIGS